MILAAFLLVGFCAAYALGWWARGRCDETYDPHMSPWYFDQHRWPR